MSDQEALDAFSFESGGAMRWMSTMMRTISPAVLLLSSAGGWPPKTLKMKLVRGVFDSIRDSAIDALGLSSVRTGDLILPTPMRSSMETYADHARCAIAARYTIRAGIEATNSELKRAHGIGRLRVRRIAKVCFAVVCKVIACNLKRWAKAHMALKRPLQGYISSLRVRVTLSFELIGVSLFQKQIFSMGEHHRGKTI